MARPSKKVTSRIPEKKVTRRVRNGEVIYKTLVTPYDLYYRNFETNQKAASDRGASFSEAVTVIELEMMDIIEGVRGALTPAECRPHLERLKKLEKAVDAKRFGKLQKEYLKKQFDATNKLVQREKKTVVSEAVKKSQQGISRGAGSIIRGAGRGVSRAGRAVLRGTGKVIGDAASLVDDTIMAQIGDDKLLSYAYTQGKKVVSKGASIVGKTLASGARRIPGVRSLFGGSAKSPTVSRITGGKGGSEAEGALDTQTQILTTHTGILTKIEGETSKTSKYLEKSIKLADKQSRDSRRGEFFTEEDSQEKIKSTGDSVDGKKPGFISKILGAVGGGLLDSVKGFGSNLVASITGGLTVVSAQLFGPIVKAVAGGVSAVLTSPAVLAAAGAGIGLYLARAMEDKIRTNVAEPVKSTGQSLSAWFGEKVHGFDYYKKLFREPDLDAVGRDRAEQWAVAKLQKDLEEKKEQFKAKYLTQKNLANPLTKYGNDETYEPFNKKLKDEVLSIDEAQNDLAAMERYVEEYKKYLEARTAKEAESGVKISPNASFKFNGQTWNNPLYTDEERAAPTPKRSATAISNKAEDFLKYLGFQGDPNKEANVLVNPSSIDNSEAGKLYKALAIPETGSKAPLNDPSRFIRTKAGSNSSAYGPVQVTKSLMQSWIKGAGKNMLNKEEMEYALRFVRQGNKFLNSSYSDPTYGAGGEGDLNNERDRHLYERVVKKLIASELRRVGGNRARFMRNWRGAEDTPYFASVNRSLRQLDAMEEQKVKIAQEKSDSQMLISKMREQGVEKDQEEARKQNVAYNQSLNAPQQTVINNNYNKSIIQSNLRHTESSLAREMEKSYGII